MRTDPTDTGGLFVGRRPGTAPVRYRRPPRPAGGSRARLDGLLAAALLGAMVFVNLLFWGPLPAAWLWVGSQVDYRTGSVSFGILSAFAGLLATLLGALVVLKRLDHLWILVRRAAGHDQRTGVLGRIFAITCVIGTVAFTAWLLVIEGPGPTLAPR